MSTQVSPDEEQISKVVSTLALDMQKHNYQFEILTSDDKTGRTYMIRIGNGAGRKVEQGRSQRYYSSDR